MLSPEKCYPQNQRQNNMGHTFGSRGYKRHMALPAQTAIPVEIFHEPDLLRAVSGRRSRQLGDMFEQWILKGCGWYWDKEIAYIEKTPEPMRPIKVYGDRRKGQFIAIYTRYRHSRILRGLCVMGLRSSSMRKAPARISCSSLP